MSTPRVAGGMVTSGPYFSMTVRLIEPHDRMVVEIEGDLDVATIPFLEGILIAAENVDPDEVDIDVSRVGFVGLLGVRALAEEAERLQVRGRPARLVGASATTQRLFTLLGDAKWLELGREHRADVRFSEHRHDPSAPAGLLARTMQAVLPGARCVSVTTAAGTRLETVASTHPLAEHLDRIQYRYRSGPCVEAVLDQVQTASEDLDEEPRWEHFAAAAAHRSIRSVISTPVPVPGGRGSGDEGQADAVAVNIYSDRPARFNLERRRLVSTLVGQAMQLAGSVSTAGGGA